MASVLIRLAVSGLGSLGIVAAQTPSVDIYTNMSTDPQATTAYATAVEQVNMANINYCQLQPQKCASAHHTYTLTTTITSPAGRKNTCSTGNVVYPALTPANVQCDATLAMDGETGAFAVNTDYGGNCTVAGQFLASVFSGDILVALKTTYYTDPIGPTLGDCDWQKLACQPGTYATCPNGITFGFYSS